MSVRVHNGPPPVQRSLLDHAGHLLLLLKLHPRVFMPAHSINAIFGKVGRIASEEVILHLVKTKCLSILLYGLECYPLNKADTRSLDFAYVPI